jgi:metal transporter CNNM
MFLTAIISWPLAWLLDQFSCKSQKDEYLIFNNNDLGTLIKHHERSEKNGGKLGQDASRIMLGALNLDSRKVGGEIHSLPRPSSGESERDAEKAELVVVHGLIVQWHVVKVININEKVDTAFIKKVRMWSYSRIPVIGEPGDGEYKEAADLSDWNGRKIFGFLHIKVCDPVPGAQVQRLTLTRTSLASTSTANATRMSLYLSRIYRCTHYLLSEMTYRLTSF